MFNLRRFLKVLVCIGMYSFGYSMEQVVVVFNSIVYYDDISIGSGSLKSLFWGLDIVVNDEWNLCISGDLVYYGF